MALYSSPTNQNFVQGVGMDVNTGRYNTQGPNGTMTWVPPTTPGGTATQVTKLTPEQQAALTAQQKTSANLSGGAAGMTPWAVGAESGPMDYSQFMPGGSHVNGGNYYDKTAGDAVYKQFSDRMEPQFQRDTAALETQMRNQGLKPGDEAWNDQIRQNNQSIADQREQAMTHSQEVAASEGSRMQGMDIAGGNYNTDQRTQQITEELQKRGYGVKEIQDMLQGMGVNVPNAPNQPIGDNYSTALARMYGQSNNEAQNKNASAAGWLALGSKALEPLVEKYGPQVVDQVKSWLGFSPAAAPASTSAVGDAVANGDASTLGDAGGSAFDSGSGFTMPGAGTYATAAGDLLQGKSLGTTAEDAAKSYAENYAKNYVKGAVTSYLGTAAAPAATSAAGAAVAGGDAAALGATDGSAFAAAPSFTMAGAVPTTEAAGGAAGAAGGGAGSAAGAGGSAAGGAAGAGIGAAIAYAGLTTAPYRLNASWWSNLNKGLTEGKSGNATYDANTPPDQQKYNSEMSLYRMLQTQNQDKAAMGGANGARIPQAFRDMAFKLGMTNKDGSVNPNWNPGPDPFVADNFKKNGYVMYNGHWVPGRGGGVGQSGNMTSRVV